MEKKPLSDQFQNALEKSKKESKSIPDNYSSLSWLGKTAGFRVGLLAQIAIF